MAKADAKEDPGWIAMQKKTFLAWMNKKLEEEEDESLLIDDLGSDLADGLVLIKLYELTAETTVRERYSLTPRTRVQRIENVNIALRAWTSLGVKIYGVSAEDIVDSNVKMILGLIWCIFYKLRFSNIVHKDKSADAGLLSWARSRVEGYPGVSVENFTTSFQSGRAFAALVHTMDAKAINFDEIAVDAEPAKTLDLAFAAAETHLGIPRLLDVADMLADRPDDKSIKMYVALLFHSAAKNAEHRGLAHSKSQLELSLSELDSKYREAAVEKETLQKMRKSLEDKLAETKEKASASQAKTAQVEAERIELKAKLDEVQDKADEKESQLRGLEESKSELERDLERKEQLASNAIKAREVLEMNGLEQQKSRLELTRRLETLSKQMSVMSDLEMQAALEKKVDKEGWLAKKGRTQHPNRSSVPPWSRGNWKRRYFVLRGNFLTYYAGKEDKKPKGVIKLEQCELVPISDREADGQYRFQLATPTRKLIARTNSAAERDEWMRALRQRIAFCTFQAATANKVPDPRMTDLFTRTQVEHLVLCDMVLNTEAARAVATHMQQHPELTTVNLERCDLDAATASMLCEGLKGRSNLTVLRLGSNALGAVGAAALASVLPTLNALTTLSLENTMLGDAGLAHLAEALPMLHKLDSLRLDNNNITASGLHDLRKGVAKLALTQLQVAHNDLGPSAAEDMTEVISQLSKLQHVDLSYNNLGEEAAPSLVAALTKNNAVTHVDLRGNAIGNTGAALVAGALAKSEQLYQVDLSDNKIMCGPDMVPDAKGVFTLTSLKLTR